jgi:hypothetical protein
VVEASTDGDASYSYPNPSLTFITAFINKIPMRILIDTGASQSFIRESALRNGQMNKWKKNNKTFWLADGTTSFSTVGEVQLYIKINNIITNVMALVVRNLSCECILGMDWLVKYRVDIHMSTHEIRLHDHQGYCLTSKRMNDKLSLTQFPVKLVGHIQLHPYQECQVTAFVPISASSGVLFHPRHQLQINKTVRIPDALLSIDEYLTSLTLYNDSDRICYLSNGTLLGKVELMDSQTSLSSVLSSGVINSISSNTNDTSKRGPIFLTDSLRATIAAAANHIDDIKNRELLVKILTQYSSLLDISKSTLAATSMNHAIRTYDHPPITTKPYPQSQRQRQDLQEHVQKMLLAKQIRASSSPWSSPALLVSKPDGSTRFVVDYRKLNQITIKDEYPLPNIEETINQLAGHLFFTKLDLKSGYLQVPIREEDKEKTAFKTKDGLYEFNVLPPGLKNAPPSFQRIMNSVVVNGNSSYCLVYLDDIIIFSKTFKEHLQHVEHILASLHRYKFQLNPAKCAFFLNEMDYLGHHINSNGLSPLDDKIKAILQLPIPKNLKEANHFIGAIGWYRKFIKDFAQIAAPIHAVTNKNKNQRHAFRWNSEQTDSFNKLRSAITSKPLVLDFPDSTSPLILSTDASDIGIGAVLRQETPSGPKILYYFSQMLTSPQRKYATIEREALAIGLAICKLRPYLLGRPFRIETDHCPLCNFHQRGSRNRRVDWWSIALSEFDIAEVKFKKGTLNCDCDLLSRYPIEHEQLQELSPSVNVITRAQAKAAVKSTNSPPMALTPATAKCHQRRPSPPSIAQTTTSTQVSSGPTIPIKRSPLDTIRIRAEQHHDTDIQTILQQHKLNPSSDLVIKDGTLYKIVNYRSGRLEVPFLPQSLIEETLFAFHDHPSAGHFGRDRTFNKLKTRCYWSQMYETICLYIKSCHKCAQYNIRRTKAPGHLQPISPPTGVFELVGLDFWGPPAAPSASGNRYVIVLTDYLTKYVIAKAVPRNTALATAEFIVETAHTYGVPAHIITDQGTHFRNELMASVSSVLGCQHIFSTPYHPQTNGQVERWNATMRPKLNALYDQERNNWDDHLAGIVSAYNTGIHATTGFSPSHLMFGREITLAFDSARPIVPLSKPSDYLNHLARHRKIILQAAQTNIVQQQQTTKRRYDQGRQNPSYEIGELVLIRQHGLRGKLDPIYNGPYRVVNRLSSNTYIVDNDQEQRQNQVHVSDMHPVFQRIFSG